MLVPDSCALCKIVECTLTCVDMVIKMLHWVSTVLLEYLKYGP